MKVSIIGGGGRVGASAAFALQCYNIVSELHLLDANEQAAQGEALDLLHGASFAGDQKIYAGNYERCSDSDLILITAGLVAGEVLAYIVIVKTFPILSGHTLAERQAV